IVGLMYELLDHFLGVPSNDWPQKFITFKSEKVAGALKAANAAAAKPAKVGPSLPAERYAGTYHDAWYGDIVVSAANGKLTIDFKSTPNMKGALDPYRYDS